MGVATILSAKKIYLLAWGEEKAQKVKECVEGPVTDTIPASYLQTHNNAHVAIDLSAAANLTRIQRPWLVTSCEWNDKLIRSAIEFDDVEVEEILTPRVDVIAVEGRYAAGRGGTDLCGIRLLPSAGVPRHH